MQNYRKLVILILVAGLFFSFSHKYYFSYTDLEIDRQTSLMKITSKLFTDDLQEAMLKQDLHEIELGASDQIESNKKRLAKYLGARLGIKFGKKSVVLKLLGYEIENEMVLVYIEGKLPARMPKQMEITNTMLFEYNPDQVNMLQVTENEKNTTKRFTIGEKKITVDL